MKWISVKTRPPAMADILFTDGETQWKGWCETTNPLEDLCFCTYEPDSDFSRLGCQSPDGVTHWMKLPLLPGKKP
jgi:hypothetical protein